MTLFLCVHVFQEQRVCRTPHSGPAKEDWPKIEYEFMKSELLTFQQYWIWNVLFIWNCKADLSTFLEILGNLGQFDQF